jgi:hypothetical protein
MSRFQPYGGLYPPFGEAPRNQPVDVPACNPLPPNKMSDDTGNAGADGYSVLSQANPRTGVRPSIDGIPQYEGPNMAQEQ